MNEKLMIYVIGSIMAIVLVGFGWFANDFAELVFDSTDAITDGARIEYLESEAFNDYCRVILNNQVTKKIEVNCNNFKLYHQNFENWCNKWNGYYLGFEGSIEDCWIDFDITSLQEKTKGDGK